MLARPALLCILVAAVCAAAGYADSALALGDAFLQSGAHSEAVTEYKRFLFFNPGDARVGETNSRIALCLLAEGRPREAEGALREAAALAGDPAEAAERRLDVVRALLADGRDGEAELELLNLQAFAGADRRSLALHLAVLRIYQGRWAEAEDSLRQVFAQQGGGVNETGPQAELQELRRLLVQGRELKRRSPQAARVLSAILSGAGQAYAGDGLDGLNALAVNGAIVTLAVACAVNGYYPETVLLVLYPLRRFYVGNIGNAGRLAERRNAAWQEAHRQRVLEVLLRVLSQERDDR